MASEVVLLDVDEPTVKKTKLELHRCTFIVPKKNRTCKLLAKAGALYCGEHSVLANDEKRIPCPLDPKHSVNISAIDDHIRNKCNARLPDASWVKARINCLHPTPDDANDSEVPSDLTDFVSLAANIVEKAHDSFKDEILFDQRKFPIVEEKLPEVEKTKHLVQISSILGHMKDSGLLKNESTAAVLELGSGRGQLAYFMASAAPQATFVLVDSSGVKHKIDNRAKSEINDVKIVRLRCGIEHVDPSKIPALASASSISVVCKHFCGVATDFGVNLIIRACSAPADDTNALAVDGFCLAPCCHHRIVVSEYTGADYLSSIGLDSPHLIAAARMMTSWATCGRPANATSQMPTNDLGDDYKLWSYEKKLALGRAAKAVFEWGRVQRLRAETNFDVKLIQYVDETVSPENSMIVGIRRR